MRMIPSDETADNTVGEEGWNAAEYVHEPVESVRIDAAVLFGDQIFTVPSQDEDANMFLSTRFQERLKTSRVCSFHCWMGYESRVVSNSFTEPSPDATASWLEWDSEKATSKSESWVSNLLHH